MYSKTSPACRAQAWLGDCLAPVTVTPRRANQPARLLLEEVASGVVRNTGHSLEGTAASECTRDHSKGHLTAQEHTSGLHLGRTRDKLTSPDQSSVRHRVDANRHEQAQDHQQALP